MSDYHIDNPTKRKVKNRGWHPVRYRHKDACFHGWIVERRPKFWLVWLIGDETTRQHPRKIRPAEQKYITEI